jgi:hypothetical protein
VADERVLVPDSVVFSIDEEIELLRDFVREMEDVDSQAAAAYRREYEILEAIRDPRGRRPADETMFRLVFRGETVAEAPSQEFAVDVARFRVREVLDTIPIRIDAITLGLLVAVEQIVAQSRGYLEFKAYAVATLIGVAMERELRTVTAGARAYYERLHQFPWRSNSMKQPPSEGTWSCKDLLDMIEYEVRMIALERHRASFRAGSILPWRDEDEERFNGTWSIHDLRGLSWFIRRQGPYHQNSARERAAEQISIAMGVANLVRLKRNKFVHMEGSIPDQDDLDGLLRNAGFLSDVKSSGGGEWQDQLPTIWHMFRHPFLTTQLDRKRR